MPPPNYNPVWSDEFGASPGRRRHGQLPDPESTSPARGSSGGSGGGRSVLVHQPASNASYTRQASLSHESEVKVPLLTSQSSVSSSSGNLGGGGGISGAVSGNVHVVNTGGATGSTREVSGSVHGSSGGLPNVPAPSYQVAARGDYSNEQTRPLLNKGSLVECRYQSTQDSGYEQSQDECNFPPPLDLDYHDPLTEEVSDPAFPSPLSSHFEPPPPEVAFETSLDYAYEQDLAQGASYRPSEDDGYAESCASSSQNTQDFSTLSSGFRDHSKSCDHSRNHCAWSSTSPFGEFMPVTVTGNSTISGMTELTPMSQGGFSSTGNSPMHNGGAKGATSGGSATMPLHRSYGSARDRREAQMQRNGSLHHAPNNSTSPLQQMHNRYTSLSPSHLGYSNTNHHASSHPRLNRTASNASTTSSPATTTTHLNGTLPPAAYGDQTRRPEAHSHDPLPLPPAPSSLQQGSGASGVSGGPGGTQSTARNNIARLTLDGLELEIQVAPQNCYAGFAPETILRASKARQRSPRPTTCDVVNPEEVGEIILSDVSREVSEVPDADFKGPARMCRNCCLRAAAFVAHIGFFVCVAILGVQIPKKKKYDVQIFILRHDENAQRELPKPYDEVALVTACIMLFLCYLVALGESYTADTDTFVTNSMSREVLQSYMRELRDQVPIVGWDVICYHLETRQVTRTTRDRWGNETTSTTEEEVKVMTHRETLRFPFRTVKDISGDINLKGTAITKMEFHQMYGFIDMATAQKFTQIKEKLKERNRYRDEKMEFKEIFAMDNLKASVTVFGEYGCLRQLMRPKIFCFFSCFLFSWPFRLLMKLTTKKKKYTVIKVLGL